MTESTKIDYVSIVQDLRDEADLCRNETATDIADLLDDAASCIVAMKSQFVALRADLAAALERAKSAGEDAFKLRVDLAAAQEELERVRDKCNEHYMALAAAQREAIAEQCTRLNELMVGADDGTTPVIRRIGALKEQLALAHDAINDALPWMIKLGDYIGNGTQADPMGRCNAILKMRIAVEKRDD